MFGGLKMNEELWLEMVKEVKLDDKNTNIVIFFKLLKDYLLRIQEIDAEINKPKHR